MPGRVALLAVFAVGCGEVEDARTGPDAHCDDYCDHFVGECHAEGVDYDECSFVCRCMYDDVVLPDIADDFVECLTTASCETVTPEFWCGGLVTSNVEPSEAVQAYIDACEERIEVLGGCPGAAFGCESVKIVIDDVVPAATACLAQPTCEQIDDCTLGAIFQQCFQ